MKLFDMFDQTPPHTLDKSDSSRKQSQTLTVSPNVKAIAKKIKYQPREQKTCHP